MFIKLLALFTIVPLVELYLLIKIGGDNPMIDRRTVIAECDPNLPRS